ncbi:MAG TPA: hypothetical protein VK848_14235, partial [Acidimicrobiia bacterium]|nr:hypothetical protein [Acidimicrobiia bacterium]
SPTDIGSATTLTTDTSGAGLGSSGRGAYSSGSSGELSLPTGGGVESSSTTAATPPSLTTGGRGEVAAGAPVRQQAAVAVTELGPKTAEWVRDLYLMAGLALGIIFVGQRLARAFS